ncbi:MAG TPA: AAC(3) family N-acetyltransferase [Anaerolineales bacterium]
MREVTREQVIDTLRGLGVRAGCGVFVHSAIQFLGRPAGGVGMYYQALQSVLNLQPSQDAGPGELNGLQTVGTLVVPTFNFAFARGEPYDPQNTPSKGMGVFCEYVRQQPEARRTPHPMQSLAAVGRYADDLAARDTPSAFDPGSAFERMLELDFMLLLLGADIQAASMIHYSEQRAAVPYRYWKEFSGQTRTAAGWEHRTYRMFARDLGADPRLDLRSVQAALQVAGQWASLPLNYGRVSLCRLADFAAAADRLLAEDPWALVSNREGILRKWDADQRG